MTNTAKSRKGQFIVAAAMFIALIILSMSLMIYSAGSRYQTLEKEPVREIVQTITDDFKRMLTIALADYSEDKDASAFKNTVSSWANKTLYCYSGMGLQLGVDIVGDSPYLSDPTEDSFEIGANVILNLDITSVGFYGYIYPAQVKLNVTVEEALWSLDPAGTDIAFLNITVQALKEGNLSVSDLEVTRLSITVYNNTHEDSRDISTRDLDVIYVSGEGIYIITLKEETLIPTGLTDIKRLNAVLEFRDGRDIQGGAQKEGTPLNLMYIGDITIWYQKKGNKHWIYTYVTILDRLENTVSGASVSIHITLPDNSSIPLTEKTENDGIAKFEYILESAPKKGDTFTATVDNVVKKGYIYDPDFNRETEDKWQN